MICGFLAAGNIRYAREHEDIIAVQGNIWSQSSVDAQDADGSIAYPYYPSTEHFCKPAQTRQDQIDCLSATRGCSKSCGLNPPTLNGECGPTVAWGFGNEAL